MTAFKAMGLQTINWIRQNDFFGHYIHLNFDQEGEAHKTLFGGLYSIFIRAFLCLYFYLNASKIITHADDDNVTTSGLLDLDALGEVDFRSDTSMLVFQVLRKQMDPSRLQFGSGDNLDEYIEMYYTQEISDYHIRNFTTIEFPAKHCELADFAKIDRGDHSDSHVDHHEEEMH